MQLGQIITVIMLAFALIGAADRCIGCRFGPGKAFEEGFMGLGPIALVMIGICTVAPLLSQYLAPLLAPLCTRLGIDPSIVAGMLLANDSGGWVLAQGIAIDPQMGRFSGAIIGCIMGATVNFALPYPFTVTARAQHPAVAKGLIIGIITIPLGCFVGGVVMGVPLLPLLRNLLPLLFFSALFVFGLLFFERITVRLLIWFGYLLTAFITVALAAAIVVKQLGLNAPNLAPFDESLLVVGSIAVVLCGAYVLLFFVRRLFGGAFSRIGARLSMNDHGVIGLITLLINPIPAAAMLKDMDDRGITVNTAALCAGMCVLGDHLAYTIATAPELAPAVMAAKFAAMIPAVLLALLLTKPRKQNG